MAYIDSGALAKAGFTDVVKPRANSAVIVLAGTEGTGKTHWALTAPKPLLYQATDFGEDGVIQKFSDEQIIRPKGGDYKLVIPHEYRAFVDRKEDDKDRRQREGRLANFVHDSFYEPFYEDYKKGIEAGVRSVVWDTALEVWEFMRLSVYGREATTRQDLQAEANAKMKEMIRLSNVNNVNLIMINRLKIKFESYIDTYGVMKWRPTTEHEMQGFDKTPELVAVNLWTRFTQGKDEEPPKYEMLVKKCRDHNEFVGVTLPALPFPELMAMLIPEVESWE